MSNGISITEVQSEMTKSFKPEAGIDPKDSTPVGSPPAGVAGNSNRIDVHNKMAKVFETEAGIELEDFTPDKIFGSPPEDFTGDESTYLNVDEVEMTFVLLHLEEAFNTNIPDDCFVKQSNEYNPSMFCNRPVSDMVDLIITTIK